MTATEQTHEQPAGAGGAAANPAAPSGPPALGPLELARWAWRQLTSMRTALVLLFLLALAAVPGSVVPQQDIDQIAVNRWKADHPDLTPVYEFLGLFDVYTSVWFSAIYLLLMVSVIGCVLPRLKVYWAGVRAQPPRTPRNLSRLPYSRTIEVDGTPDEVLERATAALRKRRYRLRPQDGSVAGERGYLREAGNLLFHVSLLLVLVAFAAGQLLGYKGGVITVVGQGFSNSLSQYDDFSAGSLFSPDDLTPVNLTVEDFRVEFVTRGPQLGQPRDFAATVTYAEEPGGPERTRELKVNHPLVLDGVSVFLVGHGYAPVVTVRDGNGDIAYEGPVVFLPEDASFSSFGVVKVPDAAPTQLGFEGLFLPTYGFTMDRGPFSQFPDALDPTLSLVPYSGDLGLDTGAPQSVYQLDKSGLEPFASADASRGAEARIKLSPGDVVELPDEAGSIRFEGVERWVKLQVSDSPGKGWALAGVVLGIVGMMGSLFVRPRRVWVRVAPAAGAPGPEDLGGPDEPDGVDDPVGDVKPRRTVVEVAGLDRSSGGDLDTEIDRLVSRIRGTDSIDPGTEPGTGARPTPTEQEETS